MGSLDGSRSPAGPASTATEEAANPTPCAENVVVAKDKDYVNSDIEMEHVKLRSTIEQMSLLEGKLQQAVNENAKLKVKQTEDSKLWQGLDSKLSSTKTLCDQLTETLHQLASQTEQAEEDKKFFEEMLGKNSKNLDEFNHLFCDLSTKLEDAEQKIISARQEILQIKQEKEEMHQSYKERLYSNDTIIKEKDSLIKQLEDSVDENKSRLMCLDSNLHCMEQELKLKDDACISLKENLANSESELQGKIQKLLEDYTLAEHHKQELLQNILKLESDNQELLGQVQSITEEKTHNAESLQGEITKRDQQVNTLENQINQLHRVLGEKEALYRFSVEREKTLEDQKLQVARIQQDNEHKQSTISAYHKELQHVQSLVETERERVSLIRKEHEVEIKSLRMDHEEECQKMKKEHELQKSKESDEIQNKRQIMLVLVLTSTASFVFTLQPFLPVTYGRYIIFFIAGLWGIGSIGLPLGLYGTLRCEQNLSRYSSRVVYTLFSISVIYGFYLVAMKIGDTSQPPVAPAPSLLKEGATDMDTDFWWTFSFCTIGFIVLMGNLWSSVMGCLTGADRDP